MWRQTQKGNLRGGYISSGATYGTLSFADRVSEGEGGREPGQKGLIDILQAKESNLQSVRERCRGGR